MISKPLKILGLSDTHNQHEYINPPTCDVLIHCGDANLNGPNQAAQFIEWYSKQKSRYKIFVAGNHDSYCEYYSNNFKQLCAENDIFYLQDSGITIRGVNFWGSPHCPRFGNWSFMHHKVGIKKYWELIPTDTNVLITHSPPHGILDEAPDIKIRDAFYNCGCKELIKRIEELPNLEHHFFGHIHENGYKSYTTLISDITYHNCSVLNGQYKLWNRDFKVIYY
jgi:Icc-related predicted phosphoesterase